MVALSNMGYRCLRHRDIDHIPRRAINRENRYARTDRVLSARLVRIRWPRRVERHDPRCSHCRGAGKAGRLDGSAGFAFG